MPSFTRKGIYTSRTRWRATEHSPTWPMLRTNNSGATWENQGEGGIATLFEYMQDEIHGDYKRLGRTREDIGGNLDKVTIGLSLDSWQPFPNRRFSRGYNDVFIPFVGNYLTGTYGLLAENAIQALIDLASVDGTAEGATQVASYVNTKLLPHLGLSDLDVVGTNFINGVKPTNPAVDTAATVAELFSERKFFSLSPSASPSSQYLNYNLGVAPTVSYFKDLKKTVENHDKLLSQYERDAGKRIRRRYEPEPTTTSVQQGSGGYTRVMTPTISDNGLWYNFQTPSSWTVSHEHTKKQWFSGAFSYPLPPEGWRRTLGQYERLYGLKPGVDTGWEVLPFSFVADYFANMGNVVNNLNSFISDGLVMPYAYVMESNKVTWRYDGIGSYQPGDGTVKTRSFGLDLFVEHHRRRAATPFGFGFDLDGITDKQKSILVALGIELLR
jgi:hypothetical protein